MNKQSFLVTRYLSSSFNIFFILLVFPPGFYCFIFTFLCFLYMSWRPLPFSCVPWSLFLFLFSPRFRTICATLWFFTLSSLVTHVSNLCYTWFLVLPLSPKPVFLHVLCCWSISNDPHPWMLLYTLSSPRHMLDLRLSSVSNFITFDYVSIFVHFCKP